jgi:transposase
VGAPTDLRRAVARGPHRLYEHRRRRRHAGRPAFLEHALVPVLRPGRVVVLDNLAPHKAARVRALIERAGCRLLFLPPYSPDFNPIEPAWSKLKTLLRGMGARTTAALDAALTALVDAITASDARGFFRHCGYAVQ